MTGIEQLNDDVELGLLMRAGKPMLLFISDGEGVRGEFLTQFRLSAGESDDVRFVQGEPDDLPGTAMCFQIGSKPVLLGIYGGQEITRSTRPWASDVKMALAAVRNAKRAAEADDTIEAAPVTENIPFEVTDDTFQQDVLESELPVLVDFWAEWCVPCKMVAPILEQLAREFAGHLRVAKVDVEANPQLSKYFRVSSIPTLMAFAGGQLLFNQAGALPEHTLRQVCTQLIEYVEQGMAPQAAGSAN